MPELLYTCPVCNRSGFLASGLKAHRCKTLNGEAIGDINLAYALKHPCKTTSPTDSQPSPMTKTDDKDNVTSITDLPDATVHALAQAGTKVTAEYAASVYRNVEARRLDWLSYAILLGAVLLAKKASCKHGDWEDFLEEFSKLLTREKFDGGVSIQTLYRYMYVAARLLNPLTDPASCTRTSELSDLATAILVAQETLSAGDIRALVLDHAAALPVIARRIAGRSLRQLISDLHAADEEAASKEPKKHKAPRGTGNTPPPPGTKDTNQLLLQFDKEWEDTVLPAFTHISNALTGKDRAIRSLPPAQSHAYWSEVSKQLTGLATRAATTAAAAQKAMQKEGLPALTAPDSDPAEILG